MPVASGIQFLVWLVTMFVASILAYSVYMVVGGGMAGGLWAVAIEFVISLT